MRNITEVITEEQAQQLDKSYEAYLNGTAKCYTIEESKTIVFSKFKGMAHNKKRLSSNNFRAISRDSK